MSDLPEIAEVQRYRYEPGDRFIIKTEWDISMQQAAELKDRLRAALRLDSSVPIAVLSNGTEVEIVNSEQ
jgi:hypothetical protein